MKRALNYVAMLGALGMLACENDDDNNSPGGGAELPEWLGGTIVEMEVTHAEPASPFALGGVVSFTFSSSGMLFIDIDPPAANGDEITMEAPSMDGAEYIWQDTAAGNCYALSLQGEAIHEVNLNVCDSGSFLTQFEPVE